MTLEVAYFVSLKSYALDQKFLEWRDAEKTFTRNNPGLTSCQLLKGKTISKLARSD